MKKDEEVYEQIAESLSGHFDVVYYVDIETGEFIESFSSFVKEVIACSGTAPLMLSPGAVISGLRSKSKVAPSVEKVLTV